MSLTGLHRFLVSIASALLIGCAETPKRPVLRPIPPPPPTPPPGVVYVPPQVVVTTNNLSGPVAFVPSTNITASAQTNAAQFEVTSNYVANAQPATAPQAGQPQVATSTPPQYEVVPERPGPDYVWRDGYWRWEGAWVWVPGQWVYQRPQVIIVPGGGFYGGWGYHHYHYGPYGGPWRYGRPHRWR